MKTFRIVVLWLFVMLLGVAFGAGLYESWVEFPHWLVRTQNGYQWNAAAAVTANSGLRFWAFITTGPLTLVTILNLVACWNARKQLKQWWMAAILFTLFERILTFTYFIPTMVSLMAMESTHEAIVTAVTWERLNALRHGLNFVGWMAALWAFKHQDQA